MKISILSYLLKEKTHGMEGICRTLHDAVFFEAEELANDAMSQYFWVMQVAGSGNRRERNDRL